MVFCTLFDSNYLDRGLVLFESLKKNSSLFKLYVLAFDEKCYEILKELNEEYLIPVSLEEFETEELLTVKKERTRGEYCWTCSSHFIAYVLDNYEDMCTYIDADLYFYSDPKILFKEIKETECNIGIIEHRFDKRRLSQELQKNSGRYCVQFNTFTNEKNSREALRWWQDRCTECCTVSADGKVFGDQKYLDDWTERFNKVHVIENIGAGVAPWNITNYELVQCEDKKPDNIQLRYLINGKVEKLVFYHFHCMQFLKGDMVNINVYNRANRTSEDLVNAIYKPYLKKIFEKRKWLEIQYGLDFSKQERKPIHLKSLLDKKIIKANYKKIRNYSFIALCQFVWYRKSGKKDIIRIN